MSIVQARQFVMGVVGLSLDEQNHLKQLLNRGAIVPLAVIDSTVDDLREIISLTPLQTGTSLLVYNCYLFFVSVLCSVTVDIFLSLFDLILFFIKKVGLPSLSNLWEALSFWESLLSFASPQEPKSINAATFCPTIGGM